MERLKILLPLFIIILAYSVTCEDMQKVKRSGWLRARQIYQFNHPPIVENDDIIIPVVYDKVIDRRDRLQKNSKAKSFENSEEKKFAGTVSIFDDDDFEIDAATTEVFDPESTTQYYDVNNSEYITEIPEAFITTPKYKKRRFKWANHSFQSKSNPVLVTSNNEHSYTGRNRFSGQRKYGDRSDSEIEHNESNVSFKKSTDIGIETYDANGMSITSIKRRPGLRRLRKNKKHHNFGHQGLSQISDVEQTETDRKDFEIEDKQVKQQSLTSSLNQERILSAESNYDKESGLTKRNRKGMRKDLRRPQNLNIGWSQESENSQSYLHTDSEFENMERKTNNEEETSLNTNIDTQNYETEIYNERSYDTQENLKGQQKYGTQRNYDKNVFPISAIINNDYSEIKASITNEQQNAKKLLLANNKVTKSEETKYDEASGSTINDNADVKHSFLSTDAEIKNSETKKSAFVDDQQTVHLSNVQTLNKNIESVMKNNYETKSGSAKKDNLNTLKFIRRPQSFAFRHYKTSEASLAEINAQSESTEIETDNVTLVVKHKSDEISNEQLSSNGAEQLMDHDNKYKLASQTILSNNISETSLFSSNTDDTSTQSHTDEMKVPENLDNIQLPNTQVSEMSSKSAESNYESESGPTVRSKISLLKYLKRPQMFATRRSYASGTSFSETRSTQSKTDEFVVRDKLKTVQKAKDLESNRNIKSATGDNNESDSESTIKTQLNTLKYLKRPQIHNIRRYNASGSRVSPLTNNEDTENTQTKTDEVVVAAELNTVQKSPQHLSNNTSQSVMGNNYESHSGSIVKNQAGTPKYLRRPQIISTQRSYASGASFESTNRETESDKTDEDIVTDIPILNVKASNKKVESATDSNYKNTSELSGKNRVSTLKYLKRPLTFATRRSYNSASSLLSKNIVTESTQNKSAESMVTKKLNTVQNMNIQSFKEKVTGSNYSDISGTSVKNQASSIKYLIKRPVTFASRRNYTPVTSDKSTNAVTKSTQNQTEESVLENKFNTDQMSSMQASNPSANSVADNNNESISGLLLRKQVSTINKFKRPQTFSTRRNYASATSLLATNTERLQNETDEIVVVNKSITAGILNKNAKLTTNRRPQIFAARPNFDSEASRTSQNTDTESTQTETTNNDFSERQDTSKILSKAVEFSSDAELNKTNESLLTTGSQLSFKRPQNLASRQYSGSKHYVKTLIAGNEREQSEPATNQMINNQASLNSSTDIDSFEIGSDNGESIVTVTDSVTTRKYFKRPQYFAIQRNSAAKASVLSSTTDTKNINDAMSNIKKSYNQDIVDKSQNANIDITNVKENTEYKAKSKLAINTNIKQDNFTTSQYQNSDVSVTSANVDLEQATITTNEKPANGAKSLISENVASDQQEKIKQSLATSIDETATIEHTQHKKAKVVTSGRVANTQKSSNSSAISNQQLKITKASFTDTAKMVDTEESQIKKKNLVLKDEEAKTSFENVNESLGTLNAQTTTDNFGEKQAKLQTLISSETEKVTEMGHELIQNDSLDYAEDLSSVEKSLQAANKEQSLHKKENILETTESVTNVKLRSQDRSKTRSRIYFRKPKVSATGRFSDSAVSSVSITTQSDNNNLKISSQRNEKSSLAKSINEQESFLEKSKSTVVSAGASPETIDASKVLLEHTVVENKKLQSKPDTKQITRTMFRTAAKFKINDGVSEETRELKPETDFTKPEQDSIKISTITTDYADTNQPARDNNITNGQQHNQPGQQHQFNHQQYFESDSSIYNSRTTVKPSKTEDIAKKELFTAARIKSNEHNQADVRTTTNHRKVVETSNTKAIETNGMHKAVRNQLTRVIASSSSNRPIEFKKEIIETDSKPFVSRQQQKVTTATRTVSSITENRGSQIKRNHSRRIVAGSRTKPVATTKKVFTSNIEPTIKISERPIEVSTFTLTKSGTEAFNPGTRRQSNFDSTKQYTYKPTLITKEVFVERPVQYSVETPAQKTSHQVIQSRTKSSSSSWTSTGSYSQDTRLHGDRNPVVPIIEQENRVFSQNGAFRYSYEAGDGTRAFGKGKLKEVSKDHAGEAVEGGFSYTDKDGNDFSMSYTADENGYRPVGAHLPTPPPIPIAIARALAYLATKSTPEPVTEPTWKH